MKRNGRIGPIEALLYAPDFFLCDRVGRPHVDPESAWKRAGLVAKSNPTVIPVRVESSDRQGLSVLLQADENLLVHGVSPSLVTWKGTAQQPPPNALHEHRQRELLDYVGSAFLPNTILGHCQLRAAEPGSGDKSHSTLESLNNRKAAIPQANHAFARKLYFQHDETELSIPLADTPNGAPDYGRYKAALKAVLELLNREEFPSIIEVRFTPNVSEGMLGPGVSHAACYIELATSMTLYSLERIVQVYNRFDRLLRDDFGARRTSARKRPPMRRR